MEREDLKQTAKDLEAYETPAWCIDAILDVEILTQCVFDPCCGRVLMTEALFNHDNRYSVRMMDVKDWGLNDPMLYALFGRGNFLNLSKDILQDIFDIYNGEFSIIMNPPFSKTCEFIEKSFELGARKILCFQKMSFREGFIRKKWFEDNPPARIWLCGDRATCWRMDIPEEERKGNSPTAYAWFVWERGHKGTETLNTIWRDRAA